MTMQIGDKFYWLPVRSIAGWTPGQQLICLSKVSSIYIPTGMIGNGQGYYLHQERCYSTLEEAKAALKEWIGEQRERLNEIEEEMNDH